MSFGWFIAGLATGAAGLYLIERSAEDRASVPEPSGEAHYAIGGMPGHVRIPMPKALGLIDGTSLQGHMGGVTPRELSRLFGKADRIGDSPYHWTIGTPERYPLTVYVLEGDGQYLGYDEPLKWHIGGPAGANWRGFSNRIRRALRAADPHRQLASVKAWER